MKKKLRLAEIVTDAGTQVRADLNEHTVADYAEALAGGAKFPPIIVFDDGRRHIAADGFHRIHAALENGETQIECDVRNGSKADRSVSEKTPELIAAVSVIGGDRIIVG